MSLHFHPKINAQFSKNGIFSQPHFPSWWHSTEYLPLQVRHIILTGVESHVCVLATCQDFTEMGYNVHVVVDCTSSRSNVDRMYAYEKMKVEAVLNIILKCLYLFLENGSLADHCRVCDPLDGWWLKVTSVQVNTSSDQRKEPRSRPRYAGR